MRTNSSRSTTPSWRTATSDARSRHRRRRSQPHLPPRLLCAPDRRCLSPSFLRPVPGPSRCAIIRTEICRWISAAVAVAVLRCNTHFSMAVRLIQLPSRHPLRSGLHSRRCSAIRHAFSSPATPRRRISSQHSSHPCALITVSSLCSFSLLATHIHQLDSTFDQPPQCANQLINLFECLFCVRQK